QSAPVVVPELWSMRADRHDVIASAGPGEIVVVPGDLGWRTGDTVCDPVQPAVLSSPKFPAPVLAVTFEPERAEHVGAVYAAVRDLAIDDPTLRVAREYDRIVVRGMGELHLEIVADMARARADVTFRVSKPWVDRRESLTLAAVGSAEAHALIAGVEQIARCEVAVEPVAGGDPATLVVEAEGAMVAVAEAGLRARLLTGSRVGALHGVRLRLLSVGGDAEAEALVEQAAAKALDDAISRAGLVELEPWVSFEVLAPAASSAAVLADLGSRGGEVGNLASGRMGARLTGRAPLARMIGYVTRLRSITKGLGQVVIRPDGFAPCA
ncbi:MAG: elongation factor G, partial [Planctomycetota bacterium]